MRRVPLLTINSVAPTLMRFGTRGTEARSSCPKILAGEIQFAIGYSEPGAGTDLAVAPHHGRTRRRRVADQRAEDLHEHRRARRLRVARVPHRSRRGRATRASRSSSCRPTAEGFSVHPDPHHGRRPHQRHVLRRRARARREPRRRGERRLGADHQPAQPRAGRDRARGLGRAPLQRGRRVGPDHRRSPTAAASSTRSGCRSTSPACGRGSSSCKLLNWKVAWAATEGAVSPADASATKVFGTEFFLEAYGLLMEVIGPESALRDDERAGRLRDRLESSYQGDARADLRRRHERGAARPHLDVRARVPQGEAVTGPMTASLDFSLSEDQVALRDLADQILDDLATPERLTAIEREPDWFDRDAWTALADAGAARRRAPRGGRRRRRFGFLDTAVVLEAIGRHVAPVPVLASIVGGAMPIATFGDDDQRARWVPPRLAGEIDPRRRAPGARQRRSDAPDHDRRPRHRRLADQRHEALRPGARTSPGRLLVPARTGVGVGVFLVDPQDRRRHADPRARRPTASRSSTSTLDGARGEPSATRPPAARSRLDVVEHAIAGPVPDPGRRERARPADDRRARCGPRAVRPADRVVPGRLPTGRRRVHRHRGDPAHRLAGRVAALSEGLPADRRGRDRQVLGRRRRPAGRARGPAPARRCRRRRRLPACAATSRGRRRTSSRSARPPASCSSLGARLAATWTVTRPGRGAGGRYDSVAECAEPPRFLAVLAARSPRRRAHRVQRRRRPTLVGSEKTPASTATTTPATTTTTLPRGLQLHRAGHGSDAERVRRARRADAEPRVREPVVRQRRPRATRSDRCSSSRSSSAAG